MAVYARQTAFYVMLSYQMIFLRNELLNFGICQLDILNAEHLSK